MPYLARLVQLAGERGVAIDDLIAGTSLQVERIGDGEAWVALPTFAQVLSRAAALTRDPGLGLELGLETKPTSHSWYGFALITARTVRDACELGIKYLSLRLPPWRLSLFTECDTAVMRFEEKQNLGEARLLVLEAFLGGALRMGEFLHGHSFADPNVEFRASYSRPAHHARFAGQLPPIVYDCPVTEVRHPAAWLDRPLMLSDRDANREVTTVLDRELQDLAPDDWVSRARSMLADPRNAYPDLVAGAAMLGVSERTLRRQLRDRGVTYRRMREDARRDAALARIAKSQASLETLARSLGYAHVAAFSRAFQRWTGESPSDYRRKTRA
jgi:AraC-like DNA-binding protein